MEDEWNEMNEWNWRWELLVAVVDGREKEMRRNNMYNNKNKWNDYVCKYLFGDNIIIIIIISSSS